MGNHDIKDATFYSDIGFMSVHYPYFKVNDFICVHDPALSQVDRDKIFLCGHIHDLFKTQKNCINVGVDVWDFKPVSETELKQFIEGNETYLNPFQLNMTEIASYLRYTKKIVKTVKIHLPELVNTIILEDNSKLSVDEFEKMFTEKFSFAKCIDEWPLKYELDHESYNMIQYKPDGLIAFFSIQDNTITLQPIEKRRRFNVEKRKLNTNPSNQKERTQLRSSK